MHATEFSFLKNTGTPTSWDADAFTRYRDRSLQWMPNDLQSMVDNSRYELDSERTFWSSSLESLEFDGKDLSLVIMSRWNDRMFRFDYGAVKAISGDPLGFRYPPTFTVQELVTLRRKWFRHTWADTGGLLYRIISKEIRFSEIHIAR